MLQRRECLERCLWVNERDETPGGTRFANSMSNPSTAVVLHLSSRQDHHRAVETQTLAPLPASDSFTLQWDLGFRISSTFPGDGAAAGPRTPP